MSGYKTATVSSILAAAYADPVAPGSFSQGSTTFAALDTVNLRATFVAPASGIVVVKFGCYVFGGANVQPVLGILEGANCVGLSEGFANATLNGLQGNLMGSKRITGLVPGSVHKYDLAIACAAGGSAVSAAYGGGESATTGFGAAYIEVWSA